MSRPVDVSRLEERHGWLGAQPESDPREECPMCEGDREALAGAGIHSPLLRPRIVPCPMCQEADHAA